MVILDVDRDNHDLASRFAAKLEHREKSIKQDMPSPSGYALQTCAKQKVSQLAQDLGFDFCDVGSLVMLRLLEAMALIWIDMSRNQNRGADFAFKLITRGAGLAPLQS